MASGLLDQLGGRLAAHVRILRHIVLLLLLLGSHEGKL